MPMIATMQSQNRRQNGFTLVEIAIVLLIVTILLGALVPTLSSQMEQKNRNETRRKMEEIKEALIGYAVVNGHLPCPAPKATPTGNALAGVFDNSLTSGVIPWVTLGTDETDAWGRRYSYSVTAAFCTGSFTLSSSGNIFVLNTTSGSNIAGNVPAIFLSHGSNGLGAYLSNGVQIPEDNTHTDEKSNSDLTTPFVSHDNTPDFDDMAVWLSPNTLFNRMVSAGKLP